MRINHVAWLYLVSSLLTGFGGSAANAADQIDDPLEPTNRAVFAANQFVDRTLLRPIAEGYQKLVPAPAQTMTGNFVANLGQPTILVNDVLQGNADRAWNTTQRFSVNSTVGVAGLFDPATKFGLPHHAANFGQTFGVWGVEPGPAIQLPVLGHSNLRDSVGSVVSSVANPMSFVPGNATANVRMTGSALGAVDGRARQFKEQKSGEAPSGDQYIASRDAHMRKQAAFVAEARQGLVHQPRR